jgi:hypothetical protein
MGGKDRQLDDHCFGCLVGRPVAKKRRWVARDREICGEDTEMGGLDREIMCG